MSLSNMQIYMTRFLSNNNKKESEQNIYADDIHTMHTLLYNKNENTLFLIKLVEMYFNPK